MYKPFYSLDRNIQIIISTNANVLYCERIFFIRDNTNNTTRNNNNNIKTYFYGTILRSVCQLTSDTGSVHLKTNYSHRNLEHWQSIAENI